MEHPVPKVEPQSNIYTRINGILKELNDIKHENPEEAKEIFYNFCNKYFSMSSKVKDYSKLSFNEFVEKYSKEDYLKFSQKEV